MDIVRLRTLTEKSVLNLEDRRYPNLTIGNLIESDEGNSDRCKYLREVYYTKSKISFIPEVLNKIGISENYRIEKPGTNFEMLSKIEKEVFSENVPFVKKSKKNSGLKLVEIRR